MFELIFFLCGLALGWVIPRPNWYITLLEKIRDRLFKS